MVVINDDNPVQLMGSTSRPYALDSWYHRTVSAGPASSKTCHPLHRLRSAP